MRKSHPINSPKKIAMLGSFQPLRALSGYCLELALAMCELGKVEFFSFKKIYPAFLYPGGDLKNDYTFPVAGHARLKVKRRLTWYNPLSWIAEGLYTQADLLHAQWWSMPLWLVYVIVCVGFKVRGKPVVFTVHNVMPHEPSLIYTMLSRMLFKLGDHFIVHSTSNREQLIKNYKIIPEQVTEIPHGPLDFYVPRNLDLNKAREEMGFDKEQKVILFFGAIRPYKGIDTALNAFVRVVNEVPQSRLLIAGKLWTDWEQYDRLMKKLEITDYVKTFLRYIPSKDVWRFFAVSDLVVIPYHDFDSQSGVGAIALSFRKPMIVTNVGGLPELVGDHRYVVPPKDPFSLAQAIVRCLKDNSRLKSMSANAEKVAAKFAWPIITEKTWGVYTKVLNI